MWGDKKGLNVLATGDFTHPVWFAELGEELEDVGDGLYRHKSGKYKTLFLYGAEISSIYKQGDKVRRVHNLVFAPNRETAAKIISELEKRGRNLKSDGRPITGLKCPDLVKIVKEINENCHVVPAHAWTPHFGVFGSLSGFDSLAEAYGDESKYVFAIETGISSDPEMNRRIPQLDNITLLSHSDPHSLHRLGREADCFEMSDNSVSYDEIWRIIKENKPTEFLYTVEFFSEEGRYHLDGHADCKFSCEPEKTEQLKGVCPVCGKLLLKGVLSRIHEFSERPSNHNFVTIPFYKTLPLDEYVALAVGTGVASKKAQFLYENCVQKYSEMYILIDMPINQISKELDDRLAKIIDIVRQEKLDIVPGYDGEYGKVSLSPEVVINGGSKLF